MKKLKRVPVYTIRIVYKSGRAHEFKCRYFSINEGSYEWAACDVNNKPILLGVDDIAAVWQVKSSRMWVFE